MISSRRSFALGNSVQSGTGWGSGNAPGLGGGSDWNYPNAGGGVLGPGANAPAWSGKTIYAEETFATPIPVHFSAANAAGFKGFQGFDGTGSGGPYVPQRVSYPVEVTPIGTKAVLNIKYPGRTETINGVSQSITPWQYGNDQPWSIRLTGTWSGTLAFENSTDSGATWNAYNLIYERVSGDPTTPSNGTVANNATANGTWRASGTSFPVGLFRVRSTSWSSGTVTINIGMRGGDASARGNFGNFTGDPKRIYMRNLVRQDPNWDNNGNTGTKFLFYSQNEGNNHFTGFIGGLGEEGTSGVFVGLQGTSFRNMPGSARVAAGTWCDLEYIFEANTPGASNGIVKAWINGQQVLNLSDVMHFGAAATPRFTAIALDPTYGGGVAPPPYDIFFQVSNSYRESAP